MPPVRLSVGHEAAYDDFGGNIQARIDGTVAIFKTKDELLKELKNHDAETISMLAHIPAEFLSHQRQVLEAYLPGKSKYLPPAIPPGTNAISYPICK